MNTQLKPIPELDNLPEARRDQLHDWLDTLGYIKTIAKLKQEWGLEITYNKLYRYYQRILQKAELDLVLEDELSVPQYLDLLNGRSIPYDKAGIQRIMHRAYHLIAEHGHSPTKLATLLRVLHYNKSCEWTDKRIAISDRLAKVREAQLALKTPRFTPANPNPNPDCDDLGPVATTVEQLRARVRKKFPRTPDPVLTAQPTENLLNIEPHPSHMSHPPDPEQMRAVPLDLDAK